SCHSRSAAVGYRCFHGNRRGVKIPVVLESFAPFKSFAMISFKGKSLEKWKSDARYWTVAINTVLVKGGVYTQEHLAQHKPYVLPFGGGQNPVRRLFFIIFSFPLHLCSLPSRFIVDFFPFLAFKKPPFHDPLPSSLAL